MLLAATANVRPAFASTPSILIYGDSLSAAYGLSPSEGWGHLLEKRLSKSPAWRVVNRSLSGETTHGGLQRFERVLGQVRPRVVVLALGANDALRGLSLAHTELNLRDMIRAARQAGSEVVLVGIAVPPNYGATYANQFQAIFPRLARAEGVRLVPFMLEGFATDLRYFQADRIHPNAGALPRILDTIWAVLSPLLEQGR
jgi:acyl-CoA thioesterase-1